MDAARRAKKASASPKAPFIEPAGRDAKEPPQTMSRCTARPPAAAPAAAPPEAQDAEPGAASASPGAPAAFAGPSLEMLTGKVLRVALDLLHVDDIEQDMPLMDSGIDSLSMVQFRNTLQGTFPGVPMPASLLFDNPSVRAVSENVYFELKALHDKGGKRPA
mmetsp:Transcript_44631/g.142247  ORF Transcript_44631/g.142247 Transcript_44631/m.142247 type:complete len:162 (+) Transcript_44631:881-1366(+)